MASSSIVTGVLLAALAGASVPLSSAGQLEPWRPQPATASAMVQAVPSDGAIAATIAQWRALQQTDSLPFDSYASFVLAHPGWPGEAANRRAAERQARTAPPTSVVAFFRRFPPLTAAGAVAQANAYAMTFQPAQAADAARRAWRMPSLTPTDEATLLTTYGSVLTPADHDARVDALLWQGMTSAAARLMPMTSAGARPVLAARLSLRTNAPEAATLANGDDPRFMSDAGFIADRAGWLRGAGASGSAEGLLARARTLTTRPGNVEKWYETLLSNARDAQGSGQFQRAYDIARQVDDAYPPATDVSVKPYGERDDYTSLVWLGGQTAYRRLGRPADAMTLFERYGRGSKAPQTRAKGFYWAGRAAEAAGLSAQAAGYYAEAAKYRDQFYGQLALERTGRPLAAPPTLTSFAIDPAARSAFDSRETVRAVRFLGQVADYQDQTAFVRQIAADASTESDHLLAAELSRSINRPDLGVMIGRSAMKNGLSDYSATGFPTVTVPTGYEGSWTIIHAIARQESQFDRSAVSGAGARGLMQLMPATAREQSGKMGLAYTPAALTTDPNLSIMLGSSYFQRVFDRFGSYPLAIAAYNAGGGNVNKWLTANGDPRTGQVEWVDWIEAIPFSETRNYVQRVIENAVVYDLMNPGRAKSHGPAPLSWYLGKAKPG